MFFYESRCRGADMKLAPDAVAALTIVPDMCKVYARYMRNCLIHVSCLKFYGSSDYLTCVKTGQINASCLPDASTLRRTVSDCHAAA